MSKPRNETPRLKFSLPGIGPDGATPLGEMRLSGVVRTSGGYAVVTVDISADGGMAVKLGPSQRVLEFVCAEHKRLLAGLANRA